MSAREDIGKLLDKWLQLTLAEGDSIQSAAWTKISEIQAEKALLQKHFLQARLHWEAQNKSHSQPDFPFRAQVSKLLSLEERNQSWLTAQINRASEKQKSYTQAHRNLQKIQRSYVRKRQIVAWQCLS